jgi:hypothetical protein
MADSGAYKVGFGKPPVNSRFKKGQSGNPKGRPKGNLNLATILDEALNERVSIRENGRTRTANKMEIAVKQVVNKAAAGDLRAFKILSELFGRSRPADGHGDVLDPLEGHEQDLLKQLEVRIRNAAREELDDTIQKETDLEPKPA